MTVYAFATQGTETIAVMQLTYFLCNVQAMASKGLLLVISRRHIISIFYFVYEPRFAHSGVFCEIWMWNVNTPPSVNWCYFLVLHSILLELFVGFLWINLYQLQEKKSSAILRSRKTERWYMATPYNEINAIFTKGRRLFLGCFVMLYKYETFILVLANNIYNWKATIQAIAQEIRFIW